MCQCPPFSETTPHAARSLRQARPTGRRQAPDVFRPLYPLSSTASSLPLRAVYHTPFSAAKAVGQGAIARWQNARGRMRMRRHEGETVSAGCCLRSPPCSGGAVQLYQFINPTRPHGQNAPSWGGLGAYGLTRPCAAHPAAWLPTPRAQKPFVRWAACDRPVRVGCCCLTAGRLPVLGGLEGAASAAWVSFTILFSALFPAPGGAPAHLPAESGHRAAGWAGFSWLLFLAPPRVASAFALADPQALALLFGFFIRERPGRQDISRRDGGGVQDRVTSSRPPCRRCWRRQCVLHYAGLRQSSPRRWARGRPCSAGSTSPAAAPRCW